MALLVSIFKAKKQKCSIYIILLPLTKDSLADKWLAIMPQVAKDIITQHRLEPNGSLVAVKDEISTPTMKERVVGFQTLV